METVRVSGAPLSVGRAYAELSDPASGGVVLFVGRVRPDRGGRGRVRALLYESHRPLAESVLRRLAREARARFGARRVVVWHRTGTLAVGVPSVLVGVAAPHRDSAFRAARWLIDQLKHEAPIWKTDLLRPDRGGARRPAGRAGLDREG
jgi:molybdopterin synthase catalytic subunit